VRNPGFSLSPELKGLLVSGDELEWVR
jgi:hypothetical protein